MDGATFQEAEVVLGARNGDQAAFGELVRAYQRRAYAVAYSLVGNREDALELAQESFAKAYRAMNRFDPKLPFYPWLHRIIRNTCINHLKKKRRRGEQSLDGMMASGYDVCATDGDPVRSAALGELRGAIAEAMGRLSPDHREILTMRHVHEMSYAEIAQCLEIPKGTVMSRLHAARRSLRDELQDKL